MSRYDQPLVKIATFPNEPLAQLWAEVLERNAIPVMLKAGGVGPGGWASTFNLEHALYVLEADAHRARRILETVSPPENEVVLDE